MGGRPAEVRAAVELRLVVPRTEMLLEALLRYDSDDPYAVHLSFPTATGDPGIEWMFARQLVAEGLVVPSGDGDVRIWPAPDDGGDPIYVELCSPSGRALFAAPRPVLVEFVRRAVELVPPGTEVDHLDLDAELQLLLHDDLS